MPSTVPRMVLVAVPPAYHASVFLKALTEHHYLVRQLIWKALPCYEVQMIILAVQRLFSPVAITLAQSFA